MRAQIGVGIRSCLIFAALLFAAAGMTCLALVLMVSPAVVVPTLFTPADYDYSQGQKEKYPAEGSDRQLAPGFILRDLDGHPVSLSQFSGRPVVLNFWATWCAPCRAEIPHLAEAYAREGDVVVFLAISIDEPAALVSRFARENGMSFPVLLDVGGDVAAEYRVNAIPVTFFVNRDGEIELRYVGGMTPGRLEKGLSRIR